MKKFLLLVVGGMCVSGCAATITPRGDVYTELLVPTSTVVVEETVVSPVVVSAPPPIVVPAPRPIVVPAPRPIAAAARPLKPFSVRPHHYAKNPGHRGSGHSKPRDSHGSHQNHGRPGR